MQWPKREDGEGGIGDTHDDVDGMKCWKLPCKIITKCLLLVISELWVGWGPSAEFLSQKGRVPLYGPHRWVATSFFLKGLWKNRMKPINEENTKKER